ncbi:Ras-related and estrogen-regulated growth inhibitor-like 1 [Homarus americanus]|uniref:small monomeric GTPase n=1 Tax=Homarus americanus TaxID=6706 RepID=A0A8J5K1F4_HOMAM|nr:Ras-related and estrogen-regulated growth inhibitor-like 1 [Homarus americanus]
MKGMWEKGGEKEKKKGREGRNVEEALGGECERISRDALVVRYITRRYIGEYDPCLERVYPHTAVIDTETLALEILDSAGQSHVSMMETDVGMMLSQETDSVRLEGNIRWADVFVLMYSVTDKCSFDDCNRLKFLINYNKRKRRIPSPTSKVGGKDGSWEVPVVLVGNKKDQGGDRMVTTEEGFKRSRDIGCHAFHEISVRESIEEEEASTAIPFLCLLEEVNVDEFYRPSPHQKKVSRVFGDAVRYWREVVKTPKLRRASSDLHDLPADPHKALHPPVSVPGSPAFPRSYASRAARRLSVRARTHPVSPSLTPIDLL